MTTLEPTPTFEERIWGCFLGVLRWPQLEALWERVASQPEGWYLYDLAGDPPSQPLAAPELRSFLRRMNKRLRREHEYDYCGIVYADNMHQPSMVKIYDPGNLGAVCGPSGGRVLPRWVMSRMQPTALRDYSAVASPPLRWWQRLLGV